MKALIIKFKCYLALTLLILGGYYLYFENDDTFYFKETRLKKKLRSLGHSINWKLSAKRHQAYIPSWPSQARYIRTLNKLFTK